MILVLVETDAEGAVEVSREVLTFARDLAAQSGGGAVDALLIGDASAEVAGQLGQYGVRTVHQATGDAFSAYGGATWASAVEAAREASGATVIAAAGTDRGNEVMAHVAARAGVAMAANVVSVASADPMVVMRQVVGGSVLEEMNLPDDLVVFSVAGHAVEAVPADSPGAAEVAPFTPEVSDADLVARVVSSEAPPPDLSGALKNARVVVGVGRGAGGANGFGPAEELAGLLGGVMGASRVATSLGWRPHHEQVGQTGSRISPDLYVACGISGAIQHWSGCSSSKAILSINTDAEAPMVTKSHYAVIGDMHEIIPAINEELKKRRG